MLFTGSARESVATLRLQKGLNDAFELDGHRVAAAVFGLSGLHLDPAFADAILLDIGLFDPVEPNSDA